MGPDALLDGLRALELGERLLTGPAALASLASDALTTFHQRPLAVVVAATEDQVVETVHLCHREGVPFVARGNGTSLSGGSVLVEGGIVIALNRLNRRYWPCSASAASSSATGVPARAVNVSSAGSYSTIPRSPETDAATAGISRSQLWQWIRHGARPLRTYELLG